MRYELIGAKNTDDTKGLGLMSLFITGYHHQQECQRTFSKLARHLLTQAASMRRKSMSLSPLSQVQNSAYLMIVKTLQVLNLLIWSWCSV